MNVAIRCALGATVLLLACGTGKTAVPFRELDSTGGQAPASFQSRVADHALHGAVMRDAVARGDLDGAHRAAHALVLLVTESEPATAGTRVGAMVDAARRVEAAQDLREATGAFAVLSYRCGSCHVAFGGPRSFPAAAPPDALDTRVRMRRHQWGAARLWEGLVAPSEEAWKSGAQVLSDAPLVEAQPGTPARPEIDKLTTTVHELGVKGAAATSPSVRVELYAQLLSTCADCHRQDGGGPSGPAR